MICSTCNQDVPAPDGFTLSRHHNIEGNEWCAGSGKEIHVVPVPNPVADLQGAIAAIAGHQPAPPGTGARIATCPTCNTTVEIHGGKYQEHRRALENEIVDCESSGQVVPREWPSEPAIPACPACPACERTDVPLHMGRFLQHSTSMRGASGICFGGGKTPEEAAKGAEEHPNAEPEVVDHPALYNKSPSGVECIDVIEHLPFNVGSAMKYLWRAGHKPGADTIEDIRKAAWYCAREIARLGGGE